mmetsp:Transcript_77887/g.137312  ORF Transcript_77887/g.137312 Transcript_77887/m.137312 type:complete len:318 (-) Transcript_77887:355-1308(-)
MQPERPLLLQDEDLWYGLLWQRCLFIVAILNFAMWWRITQYPGHIPQHKWLCLAFILGCALRGSMPRVDVERTCFYDSFLSTPLIGRTVATVAEMCYIKQVQMVAMVVQLKDIPNPSKWVVMAIAVAETSSWLGVTTTFQLFHAVEESIWTLSVLSMVIYSFIFYWRRRKTVGWVDFLLHLQDRNEATCTAYWMVVIGVPYICFMCYIDVPMYITRYLQDTADGKTYFGVVEGLVDTASCKVVTQSYNAWKEEIPWMTGYFTFFVWTSIRMLMPVQRYGLIRALFPHSKIAEKVLSDDPAPLLSTWFPFYSQKDKAA